MFRLSEVFIKIVIFNLPEKFSKISIKASSVQLAFVNWPGLRRKVVGCCPNYIRVSWKWLLIGFINNELEKFWFLAFPEFNESPRTDMCGMREKPGVGVTLTFLMRICTILLMGICMLIFRYCIINWSLTECNHCTLCTLQWQRISSKNIEPCLTSPGNKRL